MLGTQKCNIRQMCLQKHHVMCDRILIAGSGEGTWLLYSVEGNHTHTAQRPAQRTEDASAWSVYLVRDNWISDWFWFFVCCKTGSRRGKGALICTFSVVTRTSNSGLTSFHVSLVALQKRVLATVPLSARQHSDLDIIHILCGTLDKSRNSLKLRSQPLALLPKQSKYYISDSHVLLSLHVILPPRPWSSLALHREEKRSSMYSSAQTAAASSGPSLQWDTFWLSVLKHPLGLRWLSCTSDF